MPSARRNPAMCGPAALDGQAIGGVLARQAHSGRGNRLEHDNEDVRTAHAAVAIPAGPHPGQCNLDVGERSPSARCDKGFHLTHCPPRAAISRVVCHQRSVSGLPHFGMSQLFTAEVTLLLQGGAESGAERRSSSPSFRRSDGAPLRAETETADRTINISSSASREPGARVQAAASSLA